MMIWARSGVEKRLGMLMAASASRNLTNRFHKACRAKGADICQRIFSGPIKNMGSSALFHWSPVSYTGCQRVYAQF